jgi:uncharacterized protein (DUF433 family)
MNPIERRNGRRYLTGTTIPTDRVWEHHDAGLEPWQIARETGLDVEQVEFAIAYEAKRRKRRNPETAVRKTRGRTQKRRGYRTEKRIESILSPYGFARVPMSGALGGKLSGDLRRDDARRKALHIVEVKRRENGHATLRRWLGQGGAELVVIDPAGGDEPVAVMTVETLCAVLREAGYA